MAAAGDLPILSFRGLDGTQLAYRQIGEGRPLVLLHGLFSSATVNWIRYGHAARIAAQGCRVIMPDLRAHGSSAKPHEVGAYPPDVLADDGFALIGHLRLTDYDLGGYSLGARTTVRMLVRGAKPARAIVAGMGLEGLTNTQARGGFFRQVLERRGTFAPGSPEWRAEAFLKTMGGDPIALQNILTTFVDTPAEAIERIDTPTLVAAGGEDQDNGSAEALAALLPHGHYVALPGNHMSAVAMPQLGSAIAAFVTAGAR